MRIEHVGYDKLRSRYPALFISHCLDDGRAAPFFARRYRDEKALLDLARRAADRGVERGVVDALARRHAACDAPRESLAAIEKLRRGAAVVVTGQQPSAGWGPLYNYYKAHAAIKYAQGIEGRGVPCVAVFWNHSDDARGGGAVAFPDRENRIREVAQPQGAPGVPLYEAGSAYALAMFASALSEALPRTEFSPWLDGLIRAAHRGSIAESFTRMLLGLLGQYGLVVVEPRQLEGEASARFFAEHLAKPGRLSAAVEEGRRRVVAEGFEDQIGRDVGLDLFEIRDGRRSRLEPGRRPQGRPSAGVALRPLLQDYVLPTCACVAGPGEVGYHAALGPAYSAFGIDQPVVIPRTTATLLEPKTARLVEKYRLRAEDLFLDEQELAGRFLASGGDPCAAVESLAEKWSKDVDEVLKDLPPSQRIARARERTAERLREVLKAMSERIRDDLDRGEETGRGQMAKLMTHLMPGGKLQERVFTPLYYAALFGPSLTSKLFAAIDPFVFSHQVITVS